MALHDRFGEGLFYLKSPKNKIDVDFYVPEEGLAVQVAYSVAGRARAREADGLRAHHYYRQLRTISTASSRE